MSPSKLLPLVSLAVLLAFPAQASEASCEEVYEDCQQQLSRHARCAEPHSSQMVKDAAAIFELQHSLETSATTAAFGPDPSSRPHIKRLLDGLKRKADSSLSRPGGVEKVLIGDLHHRHAERLTEVLEAPRACEAKALRRLERSCRAGVGEVLGLTQTGWPEHVATCLPARRSAAPSTAP